MISLLRDSARHPLPPHQFAGYQNRGFTKFAAHQYLILREMFLTEQIGHKPKKASLEKEKREQAPAAQMQFLQAVLY